MSVASGYPSHLRQLAGGRTPDFAQVYNVKLRLLAVATEELSAAEARDLFHGPHGPTMHETMLNCPVEQQQKQKQKQPQQQPAQRQPPSGGGGRGGQLPAKRPREEQQQPARAPPPP